MFKCDKQRYRKYLETLHSSNNTMLFSRPVHDNSNHLHDTNLQNKINTQNKVHVKIFVLSFSLSVTSVCVFYVAVAAVLCDVVTLFKKKQCTNHHSYTYQDFNRFFGCVFGQKSVDSVERG